MGGHGGLNILPQKSWHVYNQDNREKVARDEAKYEEEQKVLRQKNRKAESEFRHAALLARVRAQPLDAAIQSGEGVLLEDAAVPPPADTDAAADDAVSAPLPPAKHDIMASKRAVQSPDGHFNFWRAEELRAENAEAKADEVAERRRRGNPDTQTSDARFDERFKLAHAMHGKGNAPWYAAVGTTLPAEDAAKALDGGQLLAAAAERIGHDEALPLSKGMKRKQKHKDRDKKKSKHRDRTKEASLKLNARQLKASVAAMRAERESREAAERAREKQLLRRSFLG